MHKLQIANTFFEWELETQPKMGLREAFLQHPIYLQLQFLPVLYSEEPLLCTDCPGSKYGLNQEGIAKLSAPEKSMILSQFAGVAERPELRRQGHTRESRLRRHEKGPGGPLQCKAGEPKANRGRRPGRSGKMAQKGDFAGAESFAIPSQERYIEDDNEFPFCDAIESWGPSQLIAEWADRRGIAYSIPDWHIVKEINSKRFSFENSPKLPCATLLTEETQAKRWLSSFPGAKVLKSCFGVSGKGHLLIEDSVLTPWDRIARFLYREWGKKLPVIAEPWVRRILDFSTQWQIDKDRRIIYLGATICQNDARGQYQYNEVGVEKELFGQWMPHLIEHRKKVEPLLMNIANHGFFGNLGIDAMLYCLDSDSIVLHPVVEINARKTMGWAALAFQKRFFPEKKIRFSYTKGCDGYLPNSLVLKNGKQVSFCKNLHIYN